MNKIDYINDNIENMTDEQFKDFAFEFLGEDIFFELIQKSLEDEDNHDTAVYLIDVITKEEPTNEQ
jgi:hypothetical protein